MTELTSDDRATYEWQMWIADLGEVGQRRLKGASVLVSRVGGIGGVAAYELAAAGVGRIVLAHAGNVRPSDLNRQLLMTHASIGSSRVECAARRLAELNPNIEIVAVPENVSATNVERLVGTVDLVVCAAPLFEERLLLNAECVRRSVPMVDCAMYEMTGQITTIRPGVTACLACRVPDAPTTWTREFPVLGAVAGTVGGLGAVEAIKVLAGLGEPLHDRLLTFDLRDLRFRMVKLRRRAGCEACDGSG